MRNAVQRLRARRCLKLLYSAAAAVLCSAHPSPAQDQWIAGNGNWSNPANWTAGVPADGEGVSITFSDGTPRAILYDYTGAAVTINSFDLNLANASGTATALFTMSANNLSVDDGGEFIAIGGRAAFNQSGGTNSISSNLILADNAASTGVYTLSGSGTLSANAFEYTGLNGTGTFNQSGGSNSASELDLASAANSTGTYLLSNTGSLLMPVEQVGIAGLATFNQSGGTNIVNNLNLATNSGATAAYNLIGGALMTANINVGGTSTNQGGSAILTVTNSAQLSVAGTIKIWNGGHVNLNVPSTTISNLSIPGSGLLNLNGALTINYGDIDNDPVTRVLTWLQLGYNNGAWTGTSGIISTSVAGSSSAVSLGYADGDTDIGTAAGPNQLVVKYTLTGDANLDGRVNFADLVAVIQNFNQSGTDWSQGNFAYGDSTNFTDLLAVIRNFNKTLPSSSGATASLGSSTIPLNPSGQFQSTDAQLPEPAAISLAAVTSIGLLHRRRRNRSLPFKVER